MSTSPDFEKDLCEACVKYDCRIAFDAVGGPLVGKILHVRAVQVSSSFRRHSATLTVSSKCPVELNTTFMVGLPTSPLQGSQLVTSFSHERSLYAFVYPCQTRSVGVARVLAHQLH